MGAEGGARSLHHGAGTLHCARRPTPLGKSACPARDSSRGIRAQSSRHKPQQERHPGRGDRTDELDALPSPGAARHRPGPSAGRVRRHIRGGLAPRGHTAQARQPLERHRPLPLLDALLQLSLPDPSVERTRPSRSDRGPHSSSPAAQPRRTEYRIEGVGSRACGHQRIERCGLRHPRSHGHQLTCTGPLLCRAALACS